MNLLIFSVFEQRGRVLDRSSWQKEVCRGVACIPGDSTSRMVVPYIVEIENWKAITIRGIFPDQYPRVATWVRNPTSKGLLEGTLLKKGKRRRGSQTWRARSGNLRVWDTCPRRPHRTCHRSNTLTHKRTCICCPRGGRLKHQTTLHPSSSLQVKARAVLKGKGKMSMKLDMKLNFQTGQEFFYTRDYQKAVNQPRMLRKTTDGSDWRRSCFWPYSPTHFRLFNWPGTSNPALWFWMSLRSRKEGQCQEDRQ